MSARSRKVRSPGLPSFAFLPNAGLLTRVAAFGIAAVMLVAIVVVHRQHGFFMNWYGTQQGEGFEYHVLALGLALALVISGGGVWALDAVFAR